MCEEKNQETTSVKYERCPVEKLDEKENLNIPDYQRPYSWQKEQVEQLLEDLIETWEKGGGKNYLVGNIILHKEEEKLNIVDGQQRITTFALILKALGEDKKLCNLEFNHLSINRIKENYEIIKNRLEKLHAKKDEFKEFFRKQVIVTVTITKNLDKAFLFFDTQNTRGKPLARKDLLKVHHLRAMLEKKEIEEAKIVAKSWESNEKVDENEKRVVGDDFLQFLFEQLLGIIRKSVRRELQPQELLELDVYKEFRSEGESGDLNFYNQPAIFKRFEYDLKNNRVQYITHNLSFCGPYSVDGDDVLQTLPFEATQSIYGGLYFFLFTQKYVKKLKTLRQNEWFTLLDTVGGTGNGYLRKIYRAALLFYYDKFGDEKLDEFSAHLLLILLYYRLRSSSIYKEGVSRFEWGEKQVWNPFEVIYLKYAPAHIINDMKRYLLYYTNPEEISSGIKNTKKDFCNALKSKKSFFDSIEQEVWEKCYEELKN